MVPSSHFTGPTLSISASSHHSFDLCDQLFHFNLIFASTRMRCLNVTTSLYYIILTYKSFHRNTLLSDRWVETYYEVFESVNHSVTSDSATAWTVACQAPLSMGVSRKEYWMGCRFLLQRIFPIQELNLGLLHRRQILYCLSYQGCLPAFIL